MSNNIDKQNRGYSARRRPAEANAELEILDGSDSGNLNVRVRERAFETPPSHKMPPSGGMLFERREQSGSKGFFNKETAAEVADTIKGSITRPLTGLFRRPGSRAGRPKETPEPQHSPELPNKSLLEQAQQRHVEPYVQAPLKLDSLATAPQGATGNDADLDVESNSPFSKLQAMAKIDDIDLTVLSRYLHPEELVKDENVVWTWDYLYASITNDFIGAREEEQQQQQQQQQYHQTAQH